MSTADDGTGTEANPVLAARRKRLADNRAYMALLGLESAPLAPSRSQTLKRPGPLARGSQATRRSERVAAAGIQITYDETVLFGKMFMPLRKRRKRGDNELPSKKWGNVEYFNALRERNGEIEIEVSWTDNAKYYFWHPVQSFVHDVPDLLQAFVDDSRDDPTLLRRVVEFLNKG